jgi:hypothetical protein
MTSFEELVSELTTLYNEATTFFDKAFVETNSSKWEELRDEIKQAGRQLRKRLAVLGVRLIDSVKQSPLMEQADELDVRNWLRGMAACLAGMDLSIPPFLRCV